MSPNRIVSLSYSLYYETHVLTRNLRSVAPIRKETELTGKPRKKKIFVYCLLFRRTAAAPRPAKTATNGAGVAFVPSSFIVMVLL